MVLKTGCLIGSFFFENAHEKAISVNGEPIKSSLDGIVA